MYASSEPKWSQFLPFFNLGPVGPDVPPVRVGHVAPLCTALTIAFSSVFRKSPELTRIHLPTSISGSKDGFAFSVSEAVIRFKL